MTFREVPTPARFLEDHRSRGGKDLRRFVADVADGELRVMLAREPFGPQLGLHISASVGKRGQIGAFRAPTDDELKEVAALLEWDAAAMFFGRVILEEATRATRR